MSKNFVQLADLLISKLADEPGDVDGLEPFLWA